MIPARPRFIACLGAEAVEASTPYVLVDLDDAANYPHTSTGEIHLLGLLLNAEKNTDGVYDIWMGVVTENDGTDGSVTWFHVFHLEHIPVNSLESTDRFAQVIDFTLGGSNPEGVNLLVIAGAVAKLVSSQTQADDSNWKNDTGHLSPVGAAAGATGKPGVGDLVVWVEEATAGGKIDFSLTAIYETL